MDFKQKVIESFKRSKKDADVLRVSFVNWLNYLRFNQAYMEKRIGALELRINDLEAQNKIIIKTY